MGQGVGCLALERGVIRVEKRVIESMQELGFTASEGKIYLSLLQKPGATGYEVAATSGVPRSAIYNVLKKLEALGLVNASPGKPTKWLYLLRFSGR